MTREEDWPYFGEDCKALAVIVGVGMNLRLILASKKMAGIGELSLPEFRRITIPLEIGPIFYNIQYYKIILFFCQDPKNRQRLSAFTFHIYFQTNR